MTQSGFAAVLMLISAVLTLLGFAFASDHIGQYNRMSKMSVGAWVRAKQAKAVLRWFGFSGLMMLVFTLGEYQAVGAAMSGDPMAMIAIGSITLIFLAFFGFMVTIAGIWRSLKHYWEDNRKAKAQTSGETREVENV